jgi:hypothetical protein
MCRQRGKSSFRREVAALTITNDYHGFMTQASGWKKQERAHGAKQLRTLSRCAEEIFLLNYSVDVDTATKIYDVISTVTGLWSF